jgi:hypothetical protein
LGHVAGNRRDLQGPQKLQKTLVETHQGTLPLHDSREPAILILDIKTYRVWA